MTMRTRKSPLRIAPALAAALVAGASLVGCGSGEGGGTRVAMAASSTTVTAQPAAPASAATDPGEQAYQRCIACHQANGKGMPGVFPPLAGSQYVKASNVAVPIRILVNGMSGAVTVAGTKYDGVMPPYGTGVPMSDAEAAAVLSYVRRSWGNGASAVTAADVAREKAARKAKGPVTAAELAPLM